jgi:hypothetical protein
MMAVLASEISHLLTERTPVLHPGHADAQPSEPAQSPLLHHLSKEYQSPRGQNDG